MALTETKSIPLGFKALDFSLLNVVKGNYESLQSLRGEKATVVMFICNHCPYVIHVREKLISIAEAYQNQGVSFIAISSNDVEKYPEDGPDQMKKLAKDESFPFPYLYDPTQEVAKAYHAECTPDFSVFDNKLACVYRGRLDDSTPGNGRPVSGYDLSRAIDAVINGREVDSNQKPSMGCNIKWK